MTAAKGGTVDAGVTAAKGGTVAAGMTAATGGTVAAGVTAALIIATGRTDRQERFASLDDVGTIPAIRRIVMVFQRAGIERIVIVRDENDEKTEKFASHMNAVFIHSDNSAEMLESVKAGILYLREKYRSAVITHVDAPLFSVETVRALIAPDGPVCAPSYKGGAGHPILLRHECFQAVLSYNGGGGLAGAIKSSGFKTTMVDVDDEGVLVNVKYEKEFERLIEGHSLREMYPDIRIRLVREKPFYGPGAHQLLQLTEETASLREACRRMGISYSKGRVIIAAIEQQTGFPVIESRQGGAAGGNSCVTERGAALMRAYAGFSAEANQTLHELFGKYSALFF